MNSIIDRRLQGKNKSIGNRERFVRRHEAHIKDAVRRAIAKDGIKDVGDSRDISIPKRDISEPVFSHGNGGTRETVHPGNKEYVRGDRIKKPQGGQGGAGNGKGSGDGESLDDFTFTLTKEEFMKYFFDDMALPHLIRTTVDPNSKQYKSQRNGYSTSGNPESIAVVRTMRAGLGRKIALRGALDEKVGALIEEFNGHGVDLASPDVINDPARFADTEEKWSSLYNRIQKEKERKIPYLDTIDLRYRNRTKVLLPSATAKLYCVMDVSASMDEERKLLAKQFMILLNLFLENNYEEVELAFIRYHNTAQEVDEKRFFHDQESGGTTVLSGVTLLHEAIRRDLAIKPINVYVAHASDGDSGTRNDGSESARLIAGEIMPLVRYYAYVQVTEKDDDLWSDFLPLQDQFPAQFAMRQATESNQIYPGKDRDQVLAAMPAMHP